MAKSRSYPKRTLQILFGLSGNQCAAPGCTNPIIALATEKSDEAIIGQIAHIYAHSDNGPRGNPALPPQERDLPPNLILLCGVHHPLVDKQEETYPAEMLLEWKNAHEAKFSPETAEAIKRENDFNRHVYYVRMSDQDIQTELDRIRQARVFDEFPREEEASRFADTVERQDLAGGSREIRASALAWCARILSNGPTLEKAAAILAKSRELAKTEDGDIAEAFLLADADRPAALAKLAALKSPAANGAALRMVTKADGFTAGPTWAAQSGIDAGKLDSDGKHAYVAAALWSHDWDALYRVIDSVTPEDLDSFPGLLFVVAMAKMMAAASPDVRGVLLQGVPFQPRDFPLSFEAQAMADRRRATELFHRLSAYCRSVGLTNTGDAAADYALWLELRDPTTEAVAMEALRQSMRNPDEQLRRINMALRFGLSLDMAVIEQRLDQSVQFSGTGTAAEASARFSMAFHQPTAKDRALYFARHREQLYKHLHKLSLLVAEVQLLAYSGQVTTAKERLADAVTAGLDSDGKESLERMLAEAEGSDPVAIRRAQYDAVGDLESLRNLTDMLRGKEMWDDLLPFAQRLFDLTHDIEDCYLVAHTLNELDRHGELHIFLAAHRTIVDQDTNLRSLWAWSLWREGKFSDASQMLQALSAFKNTQSHRGLRVNIAISSGDWSALSTYCDEIFAERANVPADQLLHAAELAQAVGNPHAADLVKEATAKAPEDAGILANAYFQATRGGWEGSAEVSAWIQKAAATSGSNGPIQMMSLKELSDRKPAWDKQAGSVAEQLNNGHAPIFLAAELLNRSLMDFTLLPSLANPAERDVRRRSVVYAYSGARSPMPLAAKSSLAVELGALFTLTRLGLLDTVFNQFTIIIPHSTLAWLFRERSKAIFHQPSRVRDANLLKQLVNSSAIQVLANPTDPDEALAREVGKDLAEMLASAKRATAAGSPTVVVRSPAIHRLGSLMEEVADVEDYAGVLVSCGAIIDLLKTQAALTVSEEARARAFLRTQEKQWPNEPPITANTMLYLDSLSISHLKTAGLLQKFRTAGLKVFISESSDSDANDFMALENQSADQLAVIEEIRAKLNAGLTGGTVRAVRATKAEEDREFQSHPSYTVLALSEPADALLIDDRYLNQHPHMTYNGRTTPIVSTLDLLRHLEAESVISSADVLAHRTLLRQFGCQLIPVEEQEFRTHIMAATVKDGVLTETAELRAIRESLLRARMVKLVQIPLELPAMRQTHMSFMRLMREVWTASATEEDAIARADWVLNVSDVRGWASIAHKGLERNWAIQEYAQYVLQITAAPVTADSVLRDRYFAWVTERVLENVKLVQPEIFDILVQRVRELMVSGVEDALKEKP